MDRCRRRMDRRSRRRLALPVAVVTLQHLRRIDACCRRLPALPAAVAGIWLLHALAPRPAAACAVCFGAADAAAVQGLQAGILLLLAMVGVVFAGVGGFLFAAWRRIQRLHGEPTEAP